MSLHPSEQTVDLVAGARIYPVDGPSPACILVQGAEQVPVVDSVTISGGDAVVVKLDDGEEYLVFPSAIERHNSHVEA